MAAHEQLEELVLDRATAEVKKDMGNKLAQIVYEGKWFTPLREALSAMVDSMEETVTGEVRLKLYKGSVKNLVAALYENKKLSRDDMSELKKMFDLE